MRRLSLTSPNSTEACPAHPKASGRPEVPLAGQQPIVVTSRDCGVAADCGAPDQRAHAGFSDKLSEC